MKIVMGSDHVGYPLKMKLKTFIESMGHETEDIGTYSTDRADYPEYGRKAALHVVSNKADRAVLVCGTGFGISLAANKVPGIRCVNCSDPYTAQLSRLHNDSNAISLGARVIGEELAKMILKLWLEAGFEGGRHVARLQKLENFNDADE